MNIFTRSKSKGSVIDSPAANVAGGSLNFSPSNINQSSANDAPRMPFDLFKNNEYPMLFYLPPQDPQRLNYISLIEQYGGVCVVTPPSATSKVIILSSAPMPDGTTTYSPRFVDDCIRNFKLVPLEMYRTDLPVQNDVPSKNKRKSTGKDAEKRQKVVADKLPRPELRELEPGRGSNFFAIASNALNTLSGRNTNSGSDNGDDDENGDKQEKTSRFTAEEDEFILNQIRLNPIERGSHSFFTKLSQYSILERHKPVSIRSRYRIHLMHKLEWGYKTDRDGNLVYDEEGNKIKVPVDELPVRKNKFTAEDDYLLCLKIMEYAKSNLSGDDLKFELQNQDPSRSKIPETPKVPVSFFKYDMRALDHHTTESWRYRYSKVATKVGIKGYIGYYENAKKQGHPPHTMIYFLDTKKAPSDNIRSLVGSSYDDKVNVPLDEEISQVKDSNIRYISSGANTLTSKSPRKLRSSANVGSSSKTNKSGQPPAPPVLDDIDDSEDDEEDAHTNGNRTVSNKGDDAPEQSFNVTESQIDHGIRYAPKEKLKFENLFDDSLFELDRDTLDKKLNKLYKKLRKKSLPTIFNKLNKLGMKSLFVSHMIMCTNGNLSSIKKYNSIWLNGLGSEEDLLVKLPSLLNVYGESGIWNEEYDKLLQEYHYFGKLPPELSCQTSDAIQERLEFLSELGEL